MTRTLLKGLNLILLLFLLFSCVQETGTNQDLLLEQEEVFYAELIPVNGNKRIKADFEAVPRRCRVVKRYRAKGEVYRVEAEVENNGTFSSYTLLAVFDKNENGSNPQINPIKLAPVKSKGKNGKDIEVHSPEFGFTGDTDGQTYIFSLDFIKDGQTVYSQKYSITFNEDGKNKETAVGKEVIVESYDVILTGIGSDKLKIVKEVKTILGLGIKFNDIDAESSDEEILKLISNTPYKLRDNAPEKEALTIQNILLSAGAKVELIKD
ncbi:ribosomal protein L7/L12 [Algoriphagus sp.]|uniref:ribosomal protein L7/L12 n=1 Tax=Algoriphagus sp. TaxID=1872435 RepID=UPI00391DB78C